MLKSLYKLNEMKPVSPRAPASLCCVDFELWFIFPHGSNTGVSNKRSARNVCLLVIIIIILNIQLV